MKCENHALAYVMQFAFDDRHLMCPPQWTTTQTGRFHCTSHCARVFHCVHLTYFSRAGQPQGTVYGQPDGNTLTDQFNICNVTMYVRVHVQATNAQYNVCTMCKFALTINLVEP